MATHQLIKPINAIKTFFILCTLNMVMSSVEINTSQEQKLGEIPPIRVQNDIVGKSAVTILTKAEDRKCTHCNLDRNKDDLNDDDGDDDHLHDSHNADGEHAEYDENTIENAMELFDQRQNGTENYHIRVSGLLLILTPPEIPMPTTSTTEAPLVPPVPSTISSVNNPNRNVFWNGAKKRFNVRWHDREQQKRKVSRYQARIPQFIMALLRNRHHNH